MNTDQGKLLYQGSRGEAVKELQAELGLKASGVFDQETAKAVREYQAKYNLEVSGVVDSSMRAALERAKHVKPAPVAASEGKGAVDGRKKN